MQVDEGCQYSVERPSTVIHFVCPLQAHLQSQDKGPCSGAHRQPGQSPVLRPRLLWQHAPSGEHFSMREVSRAVNAERTHLGSTIDMLHSGTAPYGQAKTRL